MTPLTPRQETLLLLTCWRAGLAFIAADLAADGWQGRYGYNERRRVLFVKLERNGKRVFLESDTLPALVALLLPVCPRLAWVLKQPAEQPSLVALPHQAIKEHRSPSRGSSDPR